MNELKTLKDIRCYEPGGYDTMYREVHLREEAIKWVKMLRQAAKDTEGPERQEMWGRRVMMEDFFNLTEEDIK